KYARQQADHARERGYQAANAERLKGRSEIGKATVGLAASGVEMSGSALDIIGDIAMMNEYNAQQALIDHENQARGFELESAKYKSAAKTAKTQGWINAAGSRLSAAAGAAKGPGGKRFPDFFASSGGGVSDPWWTA